MSFANRMACAHKWEQDVAATIRQYGWGCEPFGQGQLSDNARGILRHVQTPLRWIPDLIAYRDPYDVALFDCKWGRTDTPNWSIEIAAVESDINFFEFCGLPIYYVWPDYTCSTPDSVFEVGLRRAEGWHDGAGSGTPYYLVPKVRITTTLAEVLN